MSLTPADIAFAQELFADIPGLTGRAMFGGRAFYSEGLLFALMRSDGQILLKARDAFARELEALDAERWTYTRKNGTDAEMPYWTLPDAALDDPTLACDLARRALTQLDPPNKD